MKCLKKHTLMYRCHCVIVDRAIGVTIIIYAHLRYLFEILAPRTPYMAVPTIQNLNRFRICFSFRETSLFERLGILFELLVQKTSKDVAQMSKLTSQID